MQKKSNIFEKIINKLLNEKINIKFISNKNVNNNKKTLENKDHPLLMDAIEIFNGKIVR